MKIHENILLGGAEKFLACPGRDSKSKNLVFDHLSRFGKWVRTRNFQHTLIKTKRELNCR